MSDFISSPCRFARGLIVLSPERGKKAQKLKSPSGLRKERDTGPSRCLALTFSEVAEIKTSQNSSARTLSGRRFRLCLRSHEALRIELLLSQDSARGPGGPGPRWGAEGTRDETDSQPIPDHESSLNSVL